MVSVLEECGADVNHAFVSFFFNRRILKLTLLRGQPYRVCYAQKYPSDYAVEKRNPGFLLGVVFDCMLRYAQCSTSDFLDRGNSPSLF